jgi:hypothetical protein
MGSAHPTRNAFYFIAGVIKPSVVRFPILMPAEGAEMRDRYCDFRWNAIQLLKTKGVIANFELIKEGHRWRSCLKIDLAPGAFSPFAKMMDAEYQDRFGQNITKRRPSAEYKKHKAGRCRQFTHCQNK